MINKTHSQSGNIFFMLFASVALIGAFTVGSMNTIKGLVTSMSDVTRKTVAEEKMMGGARLAIMAATGIQVHDGDCDEDGFVEPLPYRDAGSTPHPTGGGLIPLEIGASEKDPWGSAYGYCVWDAGSITVSGNNVACGGTAAKRLNGSTHAEHTTVAIISAGKDRKFSSTCNAYVDTTPADNNPDTALITRTADSDDIVMEYSYNDANGLSGEDLWKIRDTKPDTAAIDKNIDVTGAAQFTGPINLMESGLILPDDTATGACDADTDQQLRVNFTSSPPALEICDFANGGDWTAVSMGGTGAAGFCTFSPSLVETGTTNTYGYEATADLLLSGNGQTFRATTITDPLNISTWGSFSGGGTMDGIKSIAVKGNYAYTANATSNSISVVDISTAPSTTVAILQDATKLAGANDIEIYGTYAIVAAKSDNRITVVDISNPLVPVIANSGNATIQDNVRLNSPNDLAIYSNYAIVASTTGDSVTAIDLSNPLVPVVKNISGTYGYATSSTYLDGATNVEIKGAYAYVTTTTGNYLTILDVIDGYPVIIGKLMDTRFAAAQDLKVVGNYAFVGTTSGLIIVDISNPFLPEVVTAYATGGTVNSLTLKEDYIFLSQASANVLDLGCDPAIGDGTPAPTSEIPVFGTQGTAPGFLNCTSSANGPLQMVGSLSVSSGPKLLYKQGGYLFVVRNYTTHVAYTIGTDGIPVLAAGSYNGPANTVSLWGDGTYIYSLSQFGTLRALTYNGTTFTQVGTVNTGGSPANVIGYGSYIFVNSQANGLRAYSFNGTTFTLLGTYDSPGSGPSAWTDGQYVYLSDGTSGLKVLTFDGSGFTLVASLAPQSPSTSVAASYSDGDYLYVAENSHNYIYAYTFDGVNFTLKGSYGYEYDFNYAALTGDGVNIYARPGWTGGPNWPLRVMRFNGSTFSTIAIYDAVIGSIYDLFISKSHIYAAYEATNQIHVLTGFGCGQSSAPPSGLSAAIDKYRGKLGNSTATPCAIKPDNSLWCWGRDGFGEIGNGPAITADQVSPSRVSSTSGGFAKVFGAKHRNCAIKTDGTGYCWGANYGNATGIWTGSSPDAPYLIAGGHLWSEISSNGTYFSCGLKTDGTIWCWGSDFDGEMGNGAGGSSTSPLQISDAGPWVRVTTGEGFGCGIKTDGSAWCWGLDSSGGLGNDLALTSSQVPVPVAEPGPWIDISGGHSYACGIKADGSAWCWGTNNQGAAGFGSNVTQREPVPKKILDSGPWAYIKASTPHYRNVVTCGIKVDGTAWCWGGGAGNAITKVKDPGPWATIAPGVAQTCGMKFDGSVWCWGSDTHGDFGFGMLGNGPVITANQTNPSKVVGFPDASPWVWNDTNTTVSPPLVGGTTTPNYAMRSTSSISYDGTASTGLRLTGMGTTSLTASNVKSELLLDTQFATGSAQMSWSNSVAAVVKSMGIDYLTSSFEFGPNVAAATSWMSAITPQLEIAANGNVGAGTTGTVLFKLEITGGGLRLGTDATACSTFNKGTVRYVGGATPFEYCSGTAWTTF